LKRLNGEERTILILKDRNGLSYEEIGRIMDKPVCFIRSRLHRARTKAALLGRRL
jgi:DNA-directed RNA polymerase specialized sigma24 family protein